MIKAWSFSRYNTYKQCPLKAKLQFIDKIKEPPNPAMERGSKIHKIAEEYLTHAGRRLVPEELALFANMFRDLRKQYKKSISGMVVEKMWCFKRDWTETHVKDFNNIWCRIKLDVAWHEGDTTMVVNDWKTGKFRDDMTDSYMEQLELYALGAMLVNPHIEYVKPRLSYLDIGSTYPDDDMFFSREDLPDLKKKWAKKVEPMLNDETFAPCPNDFCRWCFFRNSNKAIGGGQCKF